MPVIEKHIWHYQVEIRSGRYAVNFPAYIHGYDKEQNHILTCVFFEKEEAILPENKMADGILNMYFYMSKFRLVLNLFRNESPVKFMFDSDGKGCNLITRTEPVGQNEGIGV